MMRMAEPRIAWINPALYRPEQPIALLAVVPAPNSADDPVFVQERPEGIGEVESAVRETGTALGVVPLEFHGVV